MRNYQLLTPQDFIKKHYETLNQIFGFFHRDKSSAECFNLEYIREILPEPRDLIEFIEFINSRDVLVLTYE